MPQPEVVPVNLNHILHRIQHRHVHAEEHRVLDMLVVCYRFVLVKVHLVNFPPGWWNHGDRTVVCALRETLELSATLVIYII